MIKRPKIIPKKISDKYSIDRNTFITKDKIEIDNEFETEIGDIKQDDFFPQIKIKRWDNECNFSCRLIENEPEEAILTTENDKIIWKKNKIEAHFYNLEPTEQLELGGYEFEIILKEKPISNILTFDIETQELDFFYQPKLTQEEIDNGDIRPENIIGSYAVYHKTKQGNYVALGGKNYRAGKAFHIYRPQMEDANGWKVWGEINIDVENKIQTITIPQDFLDSAVYPVRHASGETFGYTTGGGSNGGWGNNYWRAWVGSPDTGDVDKVSIYSRFSGSGSPTYTFKGVITNSSLNILTDGISDVSEEVTTGAVTWYDALYSTAPSLIGGNTYYGGAIVNSASALIYYDSGGVLGDTRVDTSNSYSSPTNPTDALNSNLKYSIYTTYTPSVGVSIPVFMRNYRNNILNS